MTACVRFAPMIGARPGELSDQEAAALAEHLATCVLASIVSWARHHRLAAAASALAPTLAAAALILYFDRASTPEPAWVDVSAEGRGTMVLETNDGPVVLLGDPEPEGS